MNFGPGRSEPSLRRRERGWGVTEYLAVLIGLMALWQGAPAVLRLIQEHHAEFSWALMIPF